ncbi:MAG: hypothetical protein AB7F43_02550 [Bacteriovoracia bacterium]
MKNFLIIIVSFIFLSNLSVFAADQPSAAESPRALYDQGQYLKAYNALQQKGLHSAADYFNAGNCLHKLGKFGQAQAYYKKALLLAGWDSDIAYNLDINSQKLSDNSFSILFFLKRIPVSLVDLIFAVTTLLMALLLFVTRLRFTTGLIAWCGALVLYVLFLVYGQAHLGVVTGDNVVARSGPKETFAELFRISSGSTIEILSEQREGYSQIRASTASSGGVGWLKNEDWIEL